MKQLRKSIIILLLFSTYCFSDTYKIVMIPDTTSYPVQKEVIKSERRRLANTYRNGSISLDSAGRKFEELLINRIIPYWYGRPWTFEGHTNSPDSGTIACGYFVSTTLKHCGVNLNRYRLAQQAALHEVQSLAIKDTLYRHFISSDTLHNHLEKSLSNGLYIVGLDNHVGYLLKHKKSLYFIHSSYLEPASVMIEEIDHSEAWLLSENYYIAPLSGNPYFIKKWLFKSPIKIITN